MILSAIAEKLKRRSKDDFKGRHFEAALILQAVSWYLRYPLSYRDIEELFLERGLEVDHSTLNRWVLAYAPLIEKRLRAFRKPHCGSIRVDETYIKVRGQWRYGALHGSLRHSVGGRDPQEGDDEDADNSFGRRGFGPRWADVAPAQARCGGTPVAGGGSGDPLAGAGRHRRDSDGMAGHLCGGR
jgi:hypothetical protein